MFTGALPFMAVGAVMAARYLPGRGGDVPRGRLNWVSFLLVAGVVSSFLNGITSGQRDGWSSVAALSLLLAAALAMMAFIEVESPTRHPLLNLRLFHPPHLPRRLGGQRDLRRRHVRYTFYLLPIFVRTVQGFTGTKAGMLLQYANLPSFVVFPIAGWIAQRVRAVDPVAAGMLLFGLSSFALSFVDADTAFATLAGWSALSMVGLALVMPARSAVGLQDLGRDLLPYGAGTLTFVRMLGGALGVNFLAIVLETRSAVDADVFTATQTAETGATAGLLHGVVDLLARGGVSAAEGWPYTGEPMNGLA